MVFAVLVSPLEWDFFQNIYHSFGDEKIQLFDQHLQHDPLRMFSSGSRVLLRLFEGVHEDIENSDGFTDRFISSEISSTTNYDTSTTHIEIHWGSSVRRKVTKTKSKNLIPIIEMITTAALSLERIYGIWSRFQARYSECA